MKIISLIAGLLLSLSASAGWWEGGGGSGGGGGGSGTVTSVATGAGLTGGTITTAGTLNLANVAATSHQWIDSVVANALHKSQPGFADISGTLLAAQWPTLTSNAFLTGGGAGAAPNAVAITGLVLGNGASAPTAYAGAAACTNQFVTALSAAGASTCTTATLAGAQFANQGTTTTVLHGNAAGNPSFGAVSLSTDASGTLQAGQFPALTGDITTSAGALATSLKNTGTAGTYTKSTFDAQGRETSGTSAVLASSDYANQGTTTTLLHGNGAGNPSFAAVGLTTDVTGILPPANGGMGVANNAASLFTISGAFPITLTLTASRSLTASADGTIYTSGNAIATGTLPGAAGGLAYISSVASLGTISFGNAITLHALTIGGGTGAPTPLASLGTSTTVLHGAAAGDPTFGAVSLTADVSGVLPLANGGTNSADYTTATVTYTNKRLTARVVSMADATSITPTSDSADENTQVNTQSTGTLTVNIPSGTPTDGQGLLIRIKSTNVQTYSWTTSAGGYRAGTTALPTASTGGSKTDYIAFTYNAADSKWDYTGTMGGF